MGEKQYYLHPPPGRSLRYSSFLQDEHKNSLRHTFSIALLCWTPTVSLERFSYDLEKMVSVSVCYLFYQPMDEKIKTWTLHFHAEQNPNMEKA